MCLATAVDDVLQEDSVQCVCVFLTTMPMFMTMKGNVIQCNCVAH